MPRLTLVYPCIGRFLGEKYIRSWQMQPLAMASLAGMTPPAWDIAFFDDRLEQVDFDQKTDLVAISIETFTARRGYQIAAEYRSRGVPVVMGGYHATFCPDEVLQHADAVCVGEAETVWQDILDDSRLRTLKPQYTAGLHAPLKGIRPNRDIFRGKHYLPIALVEAGRGCPFACDFCSISSFYGATYRRRPVAEIVREIEDLGEKRVFFVDDNMIGDVAGAKELFSALAPLRVKWVSQASVNAARDPELMKLMVESGCVGLLVGFESLDARNLNAMSKHVNRLDEYAGALEMLRRAGIAIYGAFVFGYPYDSQELVEQTLRFGLEQQFFLCAFNHVTPFPGTPLYSRLEASNRLLHDRWWLSDEYRFGQVPFDAQPLGAAGVERLCDRARRRFYSTHSILRRGLDLRANCRGATKTAVFFGLNFLLQREVSQKRGIPLGERDTVRDG